MENPVVPASDGSFWTVCGTGPCVAVTRDRGTTWQTKSIVDNARSVDWKSTSDGQTVYASVRTDTGSRLMRSTDGGTSWTEVLAPAQPGLAGQVLPDGSVIIAEDGDQGGLYRLAPGGSTLQKLAGAPARPGMLYLTGGALVAAQVWDESDDPDLGSMVSVSTDGGTTWTAVPAPTA